MADVSVGTPISQTKHLSYLDGFRALMALYVVVHHASHYFGLDADASRPYHLLYMLSSKGHYAVDIFIVISGYCLFLPVGRNNGALRDNYWGFIKKRARRILPPYYIATTVSILIVFLLWLSNKQPVRLEPLDKITGWDLLTHLVLIQDAFVETANSLNHALWSISVEWRIYFLFPVIVVLLRRFNAVTVLVLAAAVVLVAFTVARYFGLNLGITGINPHYLLLFILGIIAAKASYLTADAVDKRHSLMGWYVVFGILALLTAVADWRTEWESYEIDVLGTNYVLLDVLVGLSSACLLVIVARGGFSYLRKLLSWQPLSLTGTFAYSIYLIHAPLLEAIYVYLLTPLYISPFAGILFMDVVGVVFIIAISYLFYLLAEKPFMTKKKTVAA
ncbi:acyltransferase family protein [Hymenobacter daeguensis]